MADGDFLAAGAGGALSGAFGGLRVGAGTQERARSELIGVLGQGASRDQVSEENRRARLKIGTGGKERAIPDLDFTQDVRDDIKSREAFQDIMTDSLKFSQYAKSQGYSEADAQNLFKVSKEELKNTKQLIPSARALAAGIKFAPSFEDAQFVAQHVLNDLAQPKYMVRLTVDPDQNPLQALKEINAARPAVFAEIDKEINKLKVSNTTREVLRQGRRFAFDYAAAKVIPPEPTQGEAAGPGEVGLQTFKDAAYELGRKFRGNTQKMMDSPEFLALMNRAADQAYEDSGGLGLRSLAAQTAGKVGAEGVVGDLLRKPITDVITQALRGSNDITVLPTGKTAQEFIRKNLGGNRSTDITTQSLNFVSYLIREAARRKSGASMAADDATLRARGGAALTAVLPEAMQAGTEGLTPSAAPPAMIAAGLPAPGAAPTAELQIGAAQPVQGQAEAPAAVAGRPGAMLAVPTPAAQPNIPINIPQPVASPTPDQLSDERFLANIEQSTRQSMAQAVRGQKDAAQAVVSASQAAGPVVSQLLAQGRQPEDVFEATRDMIEEALAAAGIATRDELLNPLRIQDMGRRKAIRDIGLQLDDAVRGVIRNASQGGVQSLPGAPQAMLDIPEGGASSGIPEIDQVAEQIGAEMEIGGGPQMPPEATAVARARGQAETAARPSFDLSTPKLVQDVSRALIRGDAISPQQGQYLDNLVASIFEDDDLSEMAAELGVGGESGGGTQLPA